MKLAAEKVKEYWDERARTYASQPAATTDDVYLRELEIATLIETLKECGVGEGSAALDVGCGDGYSTLAVARAIPGLRLSGVDYSADMVKLAAERLESLPELKGLVSFAVGDATRLGDACGDSLYDAVLTDRCLINLDSFESQSGAIAQVAAHVKPGGYYIAIENFVEGQENMNEARRRVGAPEIPIRWHNLYFKEAEFVESAARFFDPIVFKDFSSSYYFATRVVYSGMCQMRGEKPDYHHEIHQLAPRLPWVGQFSPIRMVVLRRKS